MIDYRYVILRVTKLVCLTALTIALTRHSSDAAARTVIKERMADVTNASL